MADEQSPQQSEEKKEDVIADYYEGVKDLERQGYETGIKTARNAIYATAALVFVGELVGASIQGLELTPLLIGIAVVEAGVFVALALWTKTKPYSAIITGLILFILMWVAAILLNGFNGAIGGIIIRIGIISYLAKAIKPAKAWEDSKKNK